MKERPILFSGEMVKAILDGRKSQTRRVIKPQPPELFKWFGFVLESTDRKKKRGDVMFEYDDAHHYARCLYGQPGDRLWVKEAWRVVGWHEGEPYYLQYKADMKMSAEPGDSNFYDEDKYSQYWLDCSEDMNKAGIPTDENGIYQIEGDPPTRWRSPLFMPRWASRINLEIANVRVERVQDISRDDAFAEGVEAVNPYVIEPGLPPGFPRAFRDYQNANNFFTADPVPSFKSLWNSINAKRGYGTEVNPWVWVIEFKVLP